MQINKKFFGRVLALATVALGAVPAAASAACPVEPISQPFLRLGDQNEYFLAPGGGFEGALQWTAAGNATVVESGGNGIDSGTQAAGLGQTSSLTSPPICVDAERPHLRFVARARSTSGTLRMDAFDEAGNKILLAKLEAGNYGTWTATPYVRLATTLGIGEAQSKLVRLRLTALNGDWLADAVYVDPYKRG